MFLLAIAAQLSAPEPKQIWFAVGDNPVPTRDALVSMRITVDPNGKLQSCEIESTSGDKDLDSYTCKITEKRARFRAARWTDGTASYGVYRLRTAWLARNQPASQFRPYGDLILTLNRPPKGVRYPATTEVALAVDEVGRILSCGPTNKKSKLALVGIACDQLRASYRPVPAKDRDGAPIRSVQNARVFFVKE